VRISAVCASLLLLSCAHAPSGSITTVVCKDLIAEDSLAGRLDPATPVVRWSRGQLTYKEIAEELKGSFRALKNKFLSDIHSQETDAINAQVAKILIEDEAKQRDQSSEEYMSSIADSFDPIDESQVQEFYDANRSRLNKSYEELSGQIRTYLEKEKKKNLVRSEITRLYEKAEVELMLPEPKLIPVRFDLKGRPRKGPKDAAVTLVEFSDFECPYCRLSASDISRRLISREENVAVVFLHYPLSFHKQAKPAAIASECAHRQGEFWAFHDALFEVQDELGEALYLKIATKLGIKIDQFKKCLTDPKALKQIEADTEQGLQAGVKGTPTIFMNGLRAPRGVPTAEELDVVIKRASP
jgi:protein-disulfide isomerase